MPTFAAPDASAHPLHLLRPDRLDSWLSDQSTHVQRWVKANGFTGREGEVCLIPGTDGGVDAIAAGLGDTSAAARGRFHLASIAQKLPEGTYKIASHGEAEDLQEHALGWLLSRYKFNRYKSGEPHSAKLICPDGVDADRLSAIAAGEFLTRDLINTPANDMSPPQLEAAARQLAQNHDAQVDVITGEALLEKGFPLVHAVGRASADAPRLIDLTWGTDGPALTLVGKGVCFDTGGLNIKPASSMGLMKKDMGGAATVLGLAHMIMALKLPVRLRVLVPAVENSISSNAFRPQDVLISRAGKTVEINNTDAEGRLVLADALTYADEAKPDALICMATLTGAARVAVGPDLAPFYTDDDELAQALQHAAKAVRDPVWRMPFHTPYETMIEPAVADLDNAPGGGFAGSITAALFLRRFVEHTAKFAHFDIYGWQPNPLPARPKGGLGQGARALLDALPKVLNL
ncbi:leucyl aminopeptidase family protein [Litoreibacter roseus]|uniref:Leucyl aminopeptidase n=1 Tax=Litoreibacter roseus TaxID=2601869 RepID=A0A6N6JFZ1_9RHOB|nr:leucyl aminopeptidase family protein [Litoreibacter roseus]GFE64710.1 leucyl aminopeptidase [Litoreibacter roseus]